jgi:hypothetical protein
MPILSLCPTPSGKLWLLLAFLPSLPVWGDEIKEADFPALHFSGFATFATTYNDNDQAGVVTSFAQRQAAEKGLSLNLDSVLGGQIDWWITPVTSVTFQGVARAGDAMEPVLRMGYLRQQLGNDLAARLGRIRTPVYFDSDVTEIGYAYLMARPALSLYGLLNSFSWIDGGDLQWRHPFGNTVMLVQGYGGRVDYEVQVPGTSGTTDGTFEDIVGLAVSAITPKVTFRASYTQVGSSILRSAELDQLNTGLTQLSGALRLAASSPMLPPGSALGLSQQASHIDDLIDPYDGGATYASIGFDAYLGAWRLMGEWVQVDPDSEMLGLHAGFQLTAGYSLGQWTPYVSFARFDRKTSHLNTQALSSTGIDSTLDAGLAQAKAELDLLAQSADASTDSISLGVRWDFRKNMDLKVQYDHFRTPSSSTPGILSVETLPFRNEVNLFTVGIDVIF